MFKKEKLEQAMTLLGDLTQEQKALIMEAAEKGMPDKELFEKLGGGIEEKKFGDFLLAALDKEESDVFKQELSKEELDAAAGAGSSSGENWDRCVVQATRNIYGVYWEGGVCYNIGFPDCAATVEDGSFCWKNDACYGTSVSYFAMRECSKAWR